MQSQVVKEWTFLLFCSSNGHRPIKSNEFLRQCNIMDPARLDVCVVLRENKDIFRGGDAKRTIYLFQSYWTGIMRRTPEVMMAVTSHTMTGCLGKTRRRKAAVTKAKKKKSPTGNAATERGEEEEERGRLAWSVKRQILVGIFFACVDWFCTRIRSYKLCKSCPGKLEYHNGCLCSYSEGVSCFNAAAYLTA